MHYAWLNWSLFLSAVWAVLYVSLKSDQSKREMLTMSWWTSLLGLTEPLFVPAYWSPPSLFDLATRTRFDIESLIFTFAIGGIAVVVYERIFGGKHRLIVLEERHRHQHRFHRLALIAGPIVFTSLIFLTRLNPIYPAIVGMLVGGLATWYCRPDLKKKMAIGAAIFLALYFVTLLMLEWVYPGYIERVWNLTAISGILIVGIPLEELLFAFSFGFYWSSIYEHVTWRKLL